MDLLSEIRTGGILYIILLVAITMHEFGHAFFADKLGDRLPRAEGRVTINPAAHIDMLGTVILPILTIAISMKGGFPMVFGWGKPVRVLLDNPKTRRRVDVLSTLGGVSMNLVVAFVSMLFLVVFEYFGLREFSEVALYSVYINCVLFVINMIPVPPLDGSVFLRYYAGMSEQMYFSLARWGILILLVLINVPFTSRIIMGLVRLLSAGYLFCANLILSMVS